MGRNKYLIGFIGRLETPKVNFTRVKMVCERFSVTTVVISILLQGTNLGFICSLKKIRLTVAELTIGRFGMSWSSEAWRGHRK